MTKNIFLVIKM